MIGIRNRFIEEFSLDFIYFEFWLKEIIDDIVVDGDGCVVFGDFCNNRIIKEDLVKNYKVMFFYKY